MAERNPRLEAADWLAALRDDSFDEAEARALESWHAESEANRVALGSLAMQSSKLAGMADVPEFITLRAGALSRMRERRRPMSRALVLAALLAVGAGTILWAFNSHSTRVETPVGKMTSMTLADGSIIEANSATRIEVQFDLLQRSVRLLQGEANFRVRPQWWRPFTVRTSDLTVRAVGTIFDVAELPRESHVVVSEGSVRVDTPSGHFDSVGVGYKLVYGRQLHDTTLRRARIDQDLAWREGRIRIDGVSLSDLIEEFARYSAARIELADPELGKLSISGDFDPRDPLAFARAVAKLRPLVVSEPAPGRIRLEKKRTD